MGKFRMGPDAQARKNSSPIQYEIREVIKEVPVEVEKIVYQDKIVEVEKQVFIDKIVPVEHIKVVEVEKPVEVIVEKIIKEVIHNPEVENLLQDYESMMEKQDGMIVELRDQNIKLNVELEKKNKRFKYHLVFDACLIVGIILTTIF